MENNKLKEAMEENKLLNGFNDGLHPSSGIGGNKPYFEETQKEYKETPITDEKELEKYWSIVSDKDPNKPEKYKYTKPETLKNKVFEALGEVSMCWSETPKGVFDSTNAERIGNELMKEIDLEINCYKEVASELSKNAVGKVLVTEVKELPETYDKVKLKDLLETNGIVVINPKPSLKEAVEVLCNALREDKGFNFEWQLKIQNSLREQIWKYGFDKNMVYHLTDEQLNSAASLAAKNFLSLLIEKK